LWERLSSRDDLGWKPLPQKNTFRCRQDGATRYYRYQVQALLGGNPRRLHLKLPDTERRRVDVGCLPADHLLH